MGFSHYWTQKKNIKQADWDKFMKFVRNASVMAGVKLANGFGESGTKPVVTKDEVLFNGIDGLEDDSHETFAMYNNDAGEWNCCKTAEKPYDKVVVACLESALENNIIEEWTSDGNPTDHKAGLDLHAEVVDALNTTYKVKHTRAVTPKMLNEVEAELLEGYEDIFNDVDAGYVDGIKAAISAVKERIK